MVAPQRGAGFLLALSFFFSLSRTGLKMKKSLVVIAAFVAVLGVAGCTTVGKAPVGKGPVVAKY
jgi:hypothetical protein